MTRDFPNNIIYKAMYVIINNRLNDYKTIDYVSEIFVEQSHFAWHEIKKLRKLISQYMDTAAFVDITDESNRDFNNVLNTQHNESESESDDETIRRQRRPIFL